MNPNNPATTVADVMPALARAMRAISRNHEAVVTAAPAPADSPMLWLSILLLCVLAGLAVAVLWPMHPRR